MNVLSNLGITAPNKNGYESIKEQCINVYETPSMIQSPLSGELIEDGFYTISNANGEIHGKVSKPNSVLQMSDLVDLAYNVDFEQDLGLDFSKAKLDYFKNESVCTLNIPLGVTQFTNNAGKKDETEIFMFIKNGFGGNNCIEIGVYSYRFVCSNGMEVRKGLNYFKCKHTENMNNKAMFFLGKVIPNMLNSTNKFTDLAKKLDNKLINDKDVQTFKEKMFGYKTGEEIHKIKQNQIDTFMTSFNTEINRTGLTAWGLLQSATNYTNNNHYNASKEFVITGAGAKFNAEAEKYALDLAN